MPESKWIKFVPRDTPDELKTKRWFVTPKEGHSVLGVIAWFPRWRKYTFNVTTFGAVFEEDCLQDIANFIKEETKKHRESWRKRKRESD